MSKSEWTRQEERGGTHTEQTDLWASHLAVEHALLFETQVLGRVGHYGEGGFGIMPGGRED